MSDVRQSFERLAAGLQKPVFNSAIRLAGNAEDGLDIARETFVRAFCLYAAGRRAGAFRPWLYQILVDICTERQIQQCREPHWLDALQSTEDWGASVGAAATDGEYLTRFEEGPVEQALALLPSDLRAAFILCDIEGFAYGQASRILRCSCAAVADRVWQARWSIRMALRKHSARRPPIER